MIELHYFGHRIIEEPPFLIDRPEGSFRYIFFHFITPVVIYSNGFEHEYPPGSCILYTPGTKQKWKVVKNRLNHDYLDFVITDEGFFETVKFPVNEVFNPFMSNEIKNVFTKIVDEKQLGRPDSKYLISCYLMEFFIEMSRKLNRSKRYKRQDSDIAERLENIRLKLYQEPKNYSVQSMADSLFYSLPYFSYLYKKYLNINPMDDLNNARVIYVKNLNDPTINAAKLSDDLGFNSIEYFYRWFKKNFKMTPNDFFNILKENL